jgi:hypothetical protein
MSLPENTPEPPSESPRPPEENKSRSEPDVYRWNEQAEPQSRPRQPPPVDRDVRATGFPLAGERSEEPVFTERTGDPGACRTWNIRAESADRPTAASDVGTGPRDALSLAGGVRDRIDGGGRDRGPTPDVLAVTDWNAKTTEHAPPVSMREVLASRLPEADVKRVEGGLAEAQAFNDKQGHPIDRVRRLEEVFGVEHGRLGEHGRFSPDLTRAVGLVQSELGIKVDGRLGNQTLAALERAYPWMREPLEGPYPASANDGRVILAHETPANERYDFYQRIVTERNGVWRAGRDEVNIIGIRGMTDGKQVANVVGRVNDTIAVAWLDKDGKQRVAEFSGSVDPGRGEPQNPRGMAHLVDGSYEYKLGLHRHGNRGNQELAQREIDAYLARNPDRNGVVKFRPNGYYDALVQRSAVAVYRDTDRSGPGRGTIQPREMVEDRGQFGIHMHYTHEGNPWSQGCQVIAGARGYVEFMRAVRGGSNTDALPYTIVDASKVGSILSKPRKG